MFSFVPLELYYQVFINICLVLVIFTLFHTWVLKIDDYRNLMFINIAGLILLAFIILYIGQREISGIYFGDTINYARTFHNYAIGGNIETDSDKGWHLFMKFASQIVPLSTFFTIITFIYVFPLYKLSKHYFGEYWYY